MASMAGVPTGARGRRALDATLNLVPFIDLLSCCIAFLLITAVWTTLARVDAAPGGAGAVEEGPPSRSATLDVARDGWTLRDADGVTRAATRATLPSLLAGREAVPLVVRAADDVAYAVVIDAIDVAHGAGVHIVSVSGADAF